MFALVRPIPPPIRLAPFGGYILCLSLQLLRLLMLE